MRWHIWVVFVFVILTAANAAAESFTLDPPAGILSGAPGASVGWGFTITIDTGGSIVVRGFGFDDLTPVGDQAGWFAAGVFTRAINRDNPFTAPYIEGASGLQYDIWSTATAGQHSSGRIFMVYDMYSDPNATDLIATGLIFYAQRNAADVVAEVDVAAIPEPSTVLLAAAGGVLALLHRRRIRRR